MVKPHPLAIYSKPSALTVYRDPMPFKDCYYNNIPTTHNLFTCSLSGDVQVHTFMWYVAVASKAKANGPFLCI